MKQAHAIYEEPAWVADEDIWNKAKAAVDKAKTPPENYYAVVVTVYKNMGGAIKGKSTQADSGSSNPQALRAGVAAINPLNPQEYKATHHRAKSGGVKAHPKKAAHKLDKLKKHTKKAKQCEVRFLVQKIRESATGTDDGGSTFEVYLIEEGLGNMKDLFYYSAETISASADVFAGKKIYADHPSEIEEQSRPERSVRDILGYFQEVEPVESEDGRMCLKGTVKIVPGDNFSWACELMKEAVEYSQQFEDQEFVGLSVNASGEADEVDIEDMLNDASIPDSAKVKLQKAVSEGATVIRKVSAITDAVSCDLVTEAGAGGKVLAMIEQEKKMRTKKGVKESEMKHTEDEALPPKKDGADDGDGGDDGAADTKGGHPDAEQDKKLIGEMIKKYLGKDDGGDEADHSMCAEALKHAEEMGYEGEEKIQAAGYGMKMMKHAAMKHAEKIKQSEGEEGESEESEAPPQAKPVSGSGGGISGAAPKESDMKKLQDENVALKGRVAKLEETARKVEVEKYLEKKLKESGLAMIVTKKFRESVKSFRSEKDIDEKWSIFSEAYKAGSETSGTGFVLSVERVQESEGDSVIDLSACKR